VGHLSIGLLQVRFSSSFFSLLVERLDDQVIGNATHSYVIPVADARIMEYYFNVRENYTWKETLEIES